MHCSISSLQQPAQRVSTTQDGMKMCSTSSGYSCMISTRSSRGLHKLLLYTSIRGITGERGSQCTELWNGNRSLNIWYKAVTIKQTKNHTWIKPPAPIKLTLATALPSRLISHCTSCPSAPTLVLFHLKLQNISCLFLLCFYTSTPNPFSLREFCFLWKILAQRQATSPKYHSEPKTTPAWQPRGKPSQTCWAWVISPSSLSLSSKLDWAMPGLWKKGKKLWSKSVKFHFINESGHITFPPNLTLNQKECGTEWKHSYLLFKKWCQCVKLGRAIKLATRRR